MNADDLDAVIGVDTHPDTHSAALTDPVGRHLASVTVRADADGYRDLLAWAQNTAPGPRLLWAIEGTRSHGAGLSRVLTDAGATLTEVDRPTRRSRRSGKSDPKDALLAARAALASDTVREPRSDGPREAARLLLVERDRLVRHRTAVLNQMRDLVMTAPDELRSRLRERSIAGLIAACTTLRERAGDPLETRVRVQSLRRLARLAKTLSADSATIESDLAQLAAEHVPQLVAEWSVPVFVESGLCCL